MFEKIRSFLQKVESAPQHQFKDTDPRLAAAALLVHTASIDGVDAQEEQKRLSKLLQDHYQLSADETHTLIREAREVDHEAVDLYSFTHVLKRNLNKQERLDILEMIWSIVYADGVVHEFEDNLVWRIAELLGISSRDRIFLKKQVESKLR